MGQPRERRHGDWGSGLQLRLLVSIRLKSGRCLVEYPNRAPEYGLSEDTLRPLLANLTSLSKSTVVWPDPWELLLYGDKSVLTEALDKVARLHTGTLRPLVHRLIPEEPLEAFQDHVIKRGYSGYSDSVLLPTPTRPELRWDVLLGPAEERHADYDAAWLAQPYLNLLRDPRYGEFRSYFVGGQLICTFQTVPRDGTGLAVDMLRTMYPLQVWR